MSKFAAYNRQVLLSIEPESLHTRIAAGRDGLFFDSAGGHLLGPMYIVVQNYKFAHYREMFAIRGEGSNEL